MDAQELLDSIDLEKEVWDKETLRSFFYKKADCHQPSHSYGFKFTYKPEKKPTAEELVEELK